MRILLSGGSKTNNILNAIKGKFADSGEEFVVEEYLDEIYDYLDCGYTVDKIIIAEQAIIKESEEPSEEEIRNRVSTLCSYLSSNTDAEIIILTQFKEMAVILYEESLKIRTKSAIVYKKPPYSVSFFSMLVTTPPHEISNELSFDEYEYEETTSSHEDDTYVDDEQSEDINNNYDFENETSEDNDEADWDYESSDEEDDEQLNSESDDISDTNNSGFDMLDFNFDDNTEDESDFEIDSSNYDENDNMEDETEEESSIGNEDTDIEWEGDSSDEENDDIEWDDDLDSDNNNESENNEDESDNNDEIEWDDDLDSTDDEDANTEVEEDSSTGFDEWEDTEESDENSVGTDSGFDDNFDFENDLNTDDALWSANDNEEDDQNSNSDWQESENNDFGFDDFEDDENTDEVENNDIESDDKDSDGYSGLEDWQYNDNNEDNESTIDISDDIYENMENEDVYEEDEESNNLNNVIVAENQQVDNKARHNKVFTKPSKKQKNDLDIDVENIRTRLQPFANRGNSIEVTGFNGSGTSTVAYNLANTLSNLGYTVMIVDMDTIGRTQGYISKASNDSIEAEDCSLLSAVNCASQISKYSKIIKPGMYMLSMGMGGDIASVETILNKDKLGRFLNIVKGSYNFVIYDMPFNSATNFLDDITYGCDNIMLVCEESNSGITKMLMHMCNIASEDMQETMFARGQILFNKAIGINKVFGKKTKNVYDILKEMDNKVYQLVGGDIGLYFKEMDVIGELPFDLDFENGWYGTTQYSDTQKGMKLFTDIAVRTVLKMK